jgi:hypothetical protein
VRLYRGLLDPEDHDLVILIDDQIARLERGGPVIPRITIS